jgi:hypothetical protein
MDIAVSRQVSALAGWDSSARGSPDQGSSVMIPVSVLFRDHAGPNSRTIFMVSARHNFG